MIVLKVVKINVINGKVFKGILIVNVYFIDVDIKNIENDE